jgi:hypothetical protein
VGPIALRPGIVSGLPLIGIISLFDGEYKLSNEFCKHKSNTFRAIKILQTRPKVKIAAIHLKIGNIEDNY